MSLSVSQRLSNHLPAVQVPPQAPGLDCWAICQPAFQVGGDFYECFDRPGRRFTFVVGDISGKGATAAFMMNITRTTVRALAIDARPVTPQRMINRANRALYDDFTDKGMFATLFVGQYDPTEHTLRFTNAGHNPVIYYRAGKGATLLQARSIPIGVLPEGDAADSTLCMQPGDVLFVGTDGLSEASDREGQMYGHARLLHDIEALANRPARKIVNGVCRSVREFSAGKPQEDDQTLIVLKCVG